MPYKDSFQQVVAARRHYDRNKRVCKERAKAARKVVKSRNRDFIIEYLKSHPCVDCNEGDIRVLEFDHVRGAKRTEVTTLARNGASLRTLRREIDKCAVRCANCHRRKTIERRQHRSAGDDRDDNEDFALF